MPAVIAAFESDLIRLRTREGMRVAKAKGELRGKQPKLNRRQEAHLAPLVHSGEYSTVEVAGLFGVGRSTVFPVIERQRNEARAAAKAVTASGRSPQCPATHTAAGHPHAATAFYRRRRKRVPSWNTGDRSFDTLCVSIGVL